MVPVKEAEQQRIAGRRSEVVDVEAFRMHDSTIKKCRRSTIRAGDKLTVQLVMLRLDLSTRV
jgi:hypothetical protein